MTKPLTIGVFDSGFGGLTVLRALLPLIPGARFLYLGDTARLPYGSKSRETVARYAISSARFLLNGGADLLVIACNTATALALPEITAAAAPVPVIGVIAPGAQAALSAARPDAGGRNSQTCVSPQINDPRSSTTHLPHIRLSFRNEMEESATPPHTPHATPTPHVLVLATAATVQSGAYTTALRALHLRSTEKACPLLVPLVEEGWLPTAAGHPSPQSAVTAEVLRIYLTEAQALAPDATTLLLGCTHYPLLEPLIRQTLSDLRYPLTVIDSAAATARATHALVQQLLPHRTLAPETTTTFYATDSTEKFARLGSSFLGRPLPEVHLIDLGD